MGLFLLRRCSPRSRLETEVSQTPGKAIRLHISPGNLCNPESAPSPRAGRETDASGPARRVLHRSCPRPLGQAQAALPCSPKTSWVVWGNECHPRDALPMCGGDGTCQLLARAHAGVSDTAPAPPCDGGGSRLFRGLLRSQGTCVRTVTSPGYGERLFIGSYCLSSRVAGCLVHLCTSTTDTGSDEHTRDCTCLLGTCA